MCQKQRDGRAQVLSENLLTKDTVKTFYQKNRYYQNAISKKKEKVLSKHLVRKKSLFQGLFEGLSDLCSVQLQHFEDSDTFSTYWIILVFP